MGDAVLSAGVPLSNAVACAVCGPDARPLTLKLYGTDVALLTRFPSTRNSTRLTAPPGSLALAASCTTEPLGKDAPLVGLVRLTIGGVLFWPPPLQIVPFRVNVEGALFWPLNVPLKPTVKVAPLPMLWFHAALLEMIIVGLFGGCENATGQPFCSCCPFGKSNCNVQPFVIAGPVLVIAMFAPNPLPPSQALV